MVCSLVFVNLRTKVEKTFQSAKKNILGKKWNADNADINLLGKKIFVYFASL